ncbi:MAG: hypothetical protein PHV30_10630 [Candidatus Margulisbacteria bacterium]|nr:hypothetical protein [Candidatus Margulisiibacteriota bacterium]
MAFISNLEVSSNTKSIIIADASQLSLKQIVDLIKRQYINQGNGIIIIVVQSSRQTSSFLPVDTTGRESSRKIVPAVYAEPYQPGQYGLSPDRQQTQRINFAGNNIIPGLKERIQQIMSKLPEDQRNCISNINVTPQDGPGGVMGWYDPRKPSAINLDQDDTDRNLAHTIAHESFHGFTMQKLLPAFLNYKNGRGSDSKEYGKNMAVLFQMYTRAVMAGNKLALPTDYSRSFLDLYHRVPFAQKQRALAIGFMEYIAELAANLETGNAHSGSQALDKAYTTMANIIKSAITQKQPAAQVTQTA